MPDFIYKAKNKQGKVVEGELSAKNKDKLLAKLRKDDLTPLEVKEKDGTEEPKKKKSEDKKMTEDKGLGFNMPVTEEQKAFFTNQFTTMLNAGLTLDRILNILFRQTKSKKLKQVVYEMGEDLQKGTSISGSMKKHPEVFDDMYLSMVEVGEQSGNLPTIFERLANIIEKNLSIKRRLRAAFAYPTFILVFSSILSYVLLVVFLPQFIPMFEGVGLDIPRDYPLTAILINLSKIASNGMYVTIIIASIAGLIVLYNILSQRPEVRRFVDIALLGVPVISGLIIQSSMARFCRSFGYLTSSGVPILNALNMLAKSSGNIILEEKLHKISTDVREGKSISQSLENDDFFPDIVVQMISVGEESGSVPEMMEKTADYMDEGVDNTVSSLTGMMEPAMMVCVGLVVGTFVIGILMPIFGITSKLS